MSRIRTIKPEFWVSEQMICCSHLARLLFIGMWSFADDNGIHPKSFVSIKAEVFPADNLTIDEIKSCINELIQNELIREYVVEDKWYWLITGWKKHQRIDKPTYRHPLPQSEYKKFVEYSESTSIALENNSSNGYRGIEEQSSTEWKGTEWNRKDINTCEAETSHVDDTQTDFSIFAQEIFQHWQTTMNHPKAKLDGKRQNIIKQALKLGYTPDELKQAIDGCANTPYNIGKNDRNQIYDDISLIFRDADHIERFINNANQNTAPYGRTSTDDLMAGVI